MDSDVYRCLLAKMKKFRVQTRLDLAFDRLTTLGAGGKICIVAFPDSVRKLTKTLKLLRKLHVPFVVLGRGSNVLASDDFFDGVAVVTVHVNRFNVRGRYVRAQCGASTAAVAQALAAKGLHGGEFLGCLPATVGGSVAGNAGCFGQQMADIVCLVTVLDGGKVRHIRANDCFFRRDSVFRRRNMTVLAVRMKFGRSTPQQVRQTMRQMREKKAASQPLGARSAGCVLFHERVAVSRLIDEAGMKGYRLGGAQVSQKHAGFVLNVDNASSKDIYLLIQHLQAVLRRKYGIVAKCEVQLVNFTEHTNDLFAERQE